MTIFLNVLILYAVTILTGGLIGFLKAGSQASLIMSSSFSLAFFILAYFYRSRQNICFSISGILTFVLAFFFFLRYMNTGAFMPSGLMVILSFSMLLYHFYVWKKLMPKAA